MSYIVRASWWDDAGNDGCGYSYPDLILAVNLAAEVIVDGERFNETGTVTITKDGEVIREYKVGEYSKLLGTYSPDTARYLRSKYGPSVEIINERFL